MGALCVACTASAADSRAVAIMYDLSRLRPGRDDCMKLVADWKFLVDEVNVTSCGMREPTGPGKLPVRLSGSGTVDALREL